MEHKDNPSSVFYFLCNRTRFKAYEHFFIEADLDVRASDSVEDIIRECIMEPPSAVLIDIQTGIRLGSASLHPLDNMQVLWPILRCNVTKDGFAVAVNVNPPRRDSLSNAINAIARNDRQWMNPAFGRKHLRVNTECRVRLRNKKSTIWYRGNCINISSGGFFVITYNPPAAGEEIEVEIMDLLDIPILSEAVAVWSRSWESSVKLPGAGIKFDPDRTDPALRYALADKKYVSRFVDSFKQDSY
jgi:Tfp pilus assembly protein PilZ